MATARVYRLEATTRDPVRARVHQLDIATEPPSRSRVYQLDVFTDLAPRRRLYELDVHTDVLLIANPGSDQEVDSAHRVYLNGLASSGFPTWWSWSQTSGPAVTLQPGPDSPQPSFLAPATDTGCTLTFELTVGNDEDDISEVSPPVTVTVRPHVEWAFTPTPSAPAGAWAPVLIEMFDA
jgi:hypothetical protein